MLAAARITTFVLADLRGCRHGGRRVRVLILSRAVCECATRAERERDNERYCESEFTSHISWFLLRCRLLLTILTIHFEAMAEGLPVFNSSSATHIHPPQGLCQIVERG
jgi:hypothetical protein